MAVAAIASVVRAQSQAGKAPGSGGDKRAPEVSDNPHAKRKKTCTKKGVSFHVRDNVYFARFTIDGVTRNLGRFESEERAAVAYDLAMLSLRARTELAGNLNFPDDAEREQLVEELLMRGWKIPATKVERATTRNAPPPPPPPPEEDNKDNTKEKKKKQKKEKKAKHADSKPQSPQSPSV